MNLSFNSDIKEVEFQPINNYIRPALMKYKTIPIHDIVIYKHPLLYLELTFKTLIDLLAWLKKILIKQFFIMSFIAILASLIYFIEFLHPIKIFALFSFYWVILGIASSIGLGTGLHTFVLYLGPHIAKVAMVATNCGHLPEMLPNRWEFDHFGKCEETSQTIGFIGILLAVQLESFLWGFGTALGQLPPYFVAKKAADINEQLHKMQKEAEIKEAKTNQEKQKLLHTPVQINEVAALRQKNDKTFIEKAKIVLYDSIQKYGFITILIGASIPNPLFDLAGITCGHFRVPFKKFFFATFIGKAIIKVHIQMLFVIVIFRKQTVHAIVQFINKISSSLGPMIQQIIQKQRQNLHHPSTSDNKGLVGQLWDMFIILMVGYFLLSILTSQVQEKAVQLKDKEH